MAGRQQELAGRGEGFAEKRDAQPLALDLEEREVATVHEVVAVLGDRHQLAAHAGAELDGWTRDVLHQPARDALRRRRADARRGDLPHESGLGMREPADVADVYVAREDGDIGGRPRP